MLELAIPTAVYLAIVGLPMALFLLVIHRASRRTGNDIPTREWAIFLLFGAGLGLVVPPIAHLWTNAASDPSPLGVTALAVSVAVLLAVVAFVARWDLKRACIAIAMMGFTPAFSLFFSTTWKVHRAPGDFSVHQAAGAAWLAALVLPFALWTVATVGVWVLIAVRRPSRSQTGAQARHDAPPKRASVPSLLLRGAAVGLLGWLLTQAELQLRHAPSGHWLVSVAVSIAALAAAWGLLAVCGWRRNRMRWAMLDFLPIGMITSGFSPLALVWAALTWVAAEVALFPFVPARRRYSRGKAPGPSPQQAAQQLHSSFGRAHLPRYTWH